MRDTKAAVTGCAALICIATIFMESAPSWAVVLYHLLVDGAMIAAWLFGAWGLGAIFLPKCEEPHGGLRVVTSIALGLGIFSLAMLGIGLAGWLNQGTAIALVAAGVLAAAVRLWKSRAKIDPAIRAWSNSPGGWNWLWVIIMPLLGISIAGALFPPGALWGNEPNGYDVVEYHLQVPREWYESGRITPLQYNVFSYFPFDMEMQYLLAMELRGGPWAGMYLAQFMHVSMWVLMVAAVYAGGGTFAALLAAAIPWDGLLAPVAYVEGGLVLYGALAAIWAIRWQKSGAMRDIAIAGVMAGLACGVKLTAVPWVLVAVPVALLLASRPRKWIAGAAIFLIAGMIAFSPWLIRNEIWCGNPVFPEATSVFGPHPFTPIEAKRWQEAYVPRVARIPSFFSQVIADPGYGFGLIPLGVLAAILTWRLPQTRFLAGLLIILTIVWIFFTHLQSRFYVLAIPWISLLAGELRLMRWRLAVPCAAIIAATVGIIDLQSRLERFVSENQKANGQLVGLENFWPLVQVNKDVSGLALVGDARAFLYQLPMNRLHYRTVFDVNTVPGESVIEDWLQPAPPGDWTIFIDLPELKRLTSYYGIQYPTEAQIERYTSKGNVVTNPLK